MTLFQIIMYSQHPNTSTFFIGIEESEVKTFNINNTDDRRRCDNLSSR